MALLRDGRELRAYGSQGEQRMGLLALLLAERAVLEAERGAPPLLLLDDVMSELDFGRRERLVERLRAGQALVTTTDVAHVPGADEDDVVRLRVEDGVITPMRSRAPTPSTRHEAPRAPALSHAVAALADRLAPQTTLAEIQRVWAEAVGEVVAAQAEPTGERDGVLTVTCASAVWAQELDLMGPELPSASTRRSAATPCARCAARRRPRAGWS